MKWYTIIVLAFIFIGCVSDQEDEYLDDYEIAEEVEEESEFDKLTKHFNDTELPYECNTTFDNFRKGEYLTEKEFDLLDLWEVFTEGFSYDTYSATHKIKGEGDFEMITVAYEEGEHELSTYLVTYDLDGNYISNVRLSYDDIAEGFLQISAVVEEDKITRTNTIFFDEKMEEIEIYYILEDGEIVWEEDL